MSRLGGRQTCLASNTIWCKTHDGNAYWFSNRWPNSAKSVIVRQKSNWFRINRQSIINNQVGLFLLLGAFGVVRTKFVRGDRLWSSCKKERKSYRWSDCSLQVARELLYLLMLRKTYSESFSFVITMQNRERNRIIYNLRARLATLSWNTRTHIFVNRYMYHRRRLKMYHVYFHKLR